MAYLYESRPTFLDPTIQYESYILAARTQITVDHIPSLVGTHANIAWSFTDLVPTADEWGETRNRTRNMKKNVPIVV